MLDFLRGIFGLFGPAAAKSKRDATRHGAPGKAKSLSKRKAKALKRSGAGVAPPPRVREGAGRAGSACGRQQGGRGICGDGDRMAVGLGTSDYWQCPKCNGVLRKGMGAAGALFGGILGTATCAKCGARYSQDEVYRGKWDVEVVSLVPPGVIRRTGYGWGR